MKPKRFFELTGTDQFVKFFQGCVGRNRLPIAHDALRVNDFAGQHGGTVHRERQDVHRFLAAINFHVRAGGLVGHTSGSFLGQFVIQNAPKASDVARFFNRIHIQVVSAGVVRVHLGPVGVCTPTGQQGQKYQH